MTSARQAVFAAAICIAVSVWAQGTTRPVEFCQYKIFLIQNEQRFRFKSGTNGKAADGADFSTVTYESSDGIVISAITETYASKVKAQRALKRGLGGVLSFKQST